jgi:tetratricopeptide (TPR) repeat protein
MGDSLVNRPALTANGTLAKTPLLHLLLYVHDRKLSGTIEFLTPDKGGTAAVRFLGGEPAKVRTSAPVAYLGTVLCELGFLSQEELSRSLVELQAAKATGRALHGQLLLEKRVIDRGKLDAGIRVQVSRKLEHIASMPPATAYGFYDGFDGLRGWGMDAEQGFDPMPMLWRVLRGSPPMDHVAAGLARMGSVPLKLGKTADLGRFGLGERERAAIDILRTHPMSVAELPSASGVAEEDIRLLLYLMLVTKQIEIRRPGEAISSVSAASPKVLPSGDIDAGAAPRRSSRSSFAAAARPPLAVAPPPPTLAPELAARWNEIAERAATIERADYFMMLDIARDATKDGVEAAFLELARKWHPDRLPPELAPVRDACSRVFARMSEARSTLADDEKRVRYMGLLADGSGSPESQDAVAKVIEAATDFQKAEVCFKRNDFAQAETWCRKAVAADPTQAGYHALLAWLIALKPENQSPEKTAECIKMLDRAIKLNDKSEHARYWRGMLYKRLGRNDAALKDFRLVAEVNPRNIDAAREVRLHQMRGGSASHSRSSSPPRPQASSRPGGSSVPPAKERDAAKPGLLNRLFKKP